MTRDDTPINELNRDGPEQPRKLPARTTGRALTPMQMIDKAVMAGASPEALEKLMTLQERHERNEARKAFDDAIAEFRAKIAPVIKQRTATMDLRGGGQASYQYEDLALIAEAVDPLLAELGLSYRYRSRAEGDQVYVTCIISHRLGHREETELPGPRDTTGAKNAVQAVGSTVTYLQRYTLKMALGLSATKDDDAKRSTAATETISEDQYIELCDLLEKTGRSEDTLFMYLGLPPDADMHVFTLAQYNKAKWGMQKFIDDHKPREDAGGPRQ